MSDTWILDVLADLKSFASRNGLSALAEQLDDTTLVAATEIASKQGGVRGALNVDVACVGNFHRRIGGGENA